jgi:hypothetical protein
METPTTASDIGSVSSPGVILHHPGEAQTGVGDHRRKGELLLLAAPQAAFRVHPGVHALTDVHDVSPCR